MHSPSYITDYLHGIAYKVAPILPFNPEGQFSNNAQIAPALSSCQSSCISHSLLFNPSLPENSMEFAV